MNNVAFDPKYVLTEDKTEYIAVTGDVEFPRHRNFPIVRRSSKDCATPTTLDPTE